MHKGLFSHGKQVRIALDVHSNQSEKSYMSNVSIMHKITSWQARNLDAFIFNKVKSKLPKINAHKLKTLISFPFAFIRNTKTIKLHKEGKIPLYLYSSLTRT